jgi:hypothetical protein
MDFLNTKFRQVPAENMDAAGAGLMFPAPAPQPKFGAGRNKKAAAEAAIRTPAADDAEATKLVFDPAFTLAFLEELSMDAFYQANVNGTPEHIARIMMLHRIARERAKVKTPNNLKMLHNIENNLLGVEGAKQYRKDRRATYAKGGHSDDDKAAYKAKIAEDYLVFLQSLPGSFAHDLAKLRSQLKPDAPEFSPAAAGGGF